MILKARVWNGETFISPDYITRDGFAHWKENSISKSSNKIDYFSNVLDYNKNQIFENDYINDFLNNYKGKIIFMDGSFCIELRDEILDLQTFIDDAGIPIIDGNIYEG
jgi:hypothetical protein